MKTLMHSYTDVYCYSFQKDYKSGMIKFIFEYLFQILATPV